MGRKRGFEHFGHSEQCAGSRTGACVLRLAAGRADAANGSPEALAYARRHFPITRGPTEPRGCCLPQPTSLDEHLECVDTTPTVAKPSPAWTLVKRALVKPAGPRCKDMSRDDG